MEPLRDFDHDVVRVVRQAGFRLAFTMLAGPARMAEVMARPLTVPRVMVEHTDTLAMFRLKLAGALPPVRRAADLVRRARAPGLRTASTLR